MSQSGHNPEPNREPEVPEGLARELRAAYRGEAGGTPGLDAAVLGMARARATEMAARRRLRVAGWMSAAAAAIAVASLVYVRPWGRGPAGGPGVVAGLTRGSDVNGDGAVDILDALVLAKQVEGGVGRADVNGDGVVDAADVGAIAAAAVRLGTEGRG